jgi:hypothetical protein
LAAQSPQTLQWVDSGQPLSVSDVKALVKAGISDDLIIGQIRNSRTVYYLRTADIIDLKNFGASEKLIDFMINTPSQIPSAEVAAVAGSAPQPPVNNQFVVVPAPGYYYPYYRVAPGWFWFGGSWVWRDGYWRGPRRSYGGWGRGGWGRGGYGRGGDRRGWR